jgi:hypothetical protein
MLKSVREEAVVAFFVVMSRYLTETPEKFQLAGPNDG